MPSDLFDFDGQPCRQDDLVFLAAGYGLSFDALEVPDPDMPETIAARSSSCSSMDKLGGQIGSCDQTFKPSPGLGESAAGKALVHQLRSPSPRSIGLRRDP
jgi:hypothetical protein